MSSITPTPQTSAPAKSTVRGVLEDERRLRERNGSWVATTYAATSPPSIASPPR